MQNYETSKYIHSDMCEHNYCDNPRNTLLSLGDRVVLGSFRYLEISKHIHSDHCKHILSDQLMYILLCTVLCYWSVVIMHVLGGLVERNYCMYTPRLNMPLPNTQCALVPSPYY